jgi:hypothetical protein
MDDVKIWSNQANRNSDENHPQTGSSKTITQEKTQQTQIYVSVQCMSKSIQVNATGWKTMSDVIPSIRKQLRVKQNQNIRLQIWDNDTASYVYPTSVLQLVTQFRVLCYIDN